ncbi:MAG: 30S ribosomal protein S17e [Candidatus Aenigmarchaeota archaeon]|nr:30S ribosomal protein S17e [Candidatus Aenigmarchaeota archaeon]
MGSIKSTAIKKMVEDLLKADVSMFTGDFAANKAKIETIKPLLPKKARNALAGYITRRMASTNERREKPVATDGQAD